MIGSAQAAAAPSTALPWLLVGGHVLWDPVAAAFFVSSALIWVTAGWAAWKGIEPQGRRRFYLFFMLVAAAQLGATVAGDAVTFLLFFSLLGLAAYPLVTHDGSPRSVRAGRAYLVFVLASEGALLAAALVTWGAADGAGFGGGVLGRGMALLLLLGLGVKTGLPLLHAWMPAAYAAMPRAAAAGFAGATVGVGVLGWIRFGAFASGIAPYEWMALGVAGTAFGVLRGLTRREPERVLAYSSVSQMGIVVTVLGGARGGEGATLAAAAFIAHHALAKSALFLGIDAVRVSDPSAPRPLWRWAALGLPALALAGAPLTSGALAKGALAEAVREHGVELGVFFRLSAVATTVLMLHLLRQLWRRAAEPSGEAAHSLGPWVASVVAVAGGVWLWPAFGNYAGHAVSGAAVLGEAWPVLVGIVVWSALTRSGWRAASRPTTVDRWARWLGWRWDDYLRRRSEKRPVLRHAPAHVRRRVRHAANAALRQLEAAERQAAAWAALGTLFLALVLLLRLAL